MTKIIQLGRTGKTTKVDDADFIKIMKNNWSYEGRYAHRMVKKRKIYLHTVLMGKHKGRTIDHINGDKLDNRRENLRIVSYSVNCRNKKFPNKNGLRGVTWSKRDKRWIAQMTFNYKTYYIGSFTTKEDAHQAYLERIKTLEPYV